VRYQGEYTDRRVVHNASDHLNNDFRTPIKKVEYRFGGVLCPFVAGFAQHGDGSSETEGKEDNA
jgi:hypothetical protein